MALIGGDSASVGIWLAEAIAASKAAKQSAIHGQAESRIALHELLDFSGESSVPGVAKEQALSERNASQRVVLREFSNSTSAQDIAGQTANEDWDVGGLF